MTTCFITYSWDSIEHMEWVDRFAQSLMKFGVEILYDKDRGLNPKSGDIGEFIRTSIHKSNFIVVVVTPEYVQKANTIQGYIGQETTLIRELLDMQSPSLRVLPVMRCGDVLPAYLHDKHYYDMRDDSHYDVQVTELLSSINVIRSGIALRNAVFDNKSPLPNKVFAIELLNTPVWVKRSDSRTSVSISRAGVDLAVYTVEGKQNIIDLTFVDDAAKTQARRLDEEIHRVLVGELKPQMYRIDQPNLRWASGGVLSRVQYRSRAWFSFFFRDIPPFGWNISLGASEHDDELTDPWKFMMREFIEETLVCQQMEGQQTIRRPLVHDHLNMAEEIHRAEELSAKHRRLRFERDGIVFRTSLGEPVFFDIVPTKLDIDIDGVHPTRSVLICINIGELGIEVLKVLNYELGNNDILLDGEIIDAAGKNQVELVRMPVALISEDYLRKAFAGKASFTYASPFEARMPSIEGPPITASDIVVFPHDVRRRKQLATDSSEQATDWERKSYLLWKKRFGSNFLDSDGNPSNANASTLFTPTSAKALAYYFANV